MCIRDSSYAEEGYPVPVNIARQWERDSRRIAKAMAENAAPHEYWWKYFMKPDGTPYRAGELFRFPGYAGTLRSLAATDCESYYRGELMEKIVAFSRATGGYFCEDDFRNYRPEWVEPITQDYRGYTAVSYTHLRRPRRRRPCALERSRHSAFPA